MDKTIRIEVLFPEIANLYGDMENISYLKKSCREIEVVETHLVGEPCFMEQTPDLIYMGTMTERGQRLAVEKLAAYKSKIVELIDSGVYFLVTGNALEVFGGKITDTNGIEDCGLEIFPTYAKRNMMNRFNSLYLAKFGEMDIVGYKSQFTHSYWAQDVAEDAKGYVFDTVRGPGLNPEITQEGVRKNNFFGTYVIGPLLVLNPTFAKWLLKEIGAGDVSLAFEKEAIEAYQARVAEYSNPDTGFYY